MGIERGDYSINWTGIIRRIGPKIIGDWGFGKFPWPGKGVKGKERRLGKVIPPYFILFYLTRFYLL